MTDAQRPIPIAGRGEPSDPAPSHPDGNAERPSTSPPGPAQTPLIDIHEGPDGLVLEADLPGATESTLVVQLEENVLSLQARSAATEEPPGRLIHQEFRPGAFSRSFILSDEVDRTRITAEIKDGVLRLSLPRSERARTRRIQVNSP